MESMTSELAYLAGLFDGEGSFSIQVKLREYRGRQNVLINPRMTMTLKTGTSVLEDLKRTFGGQIYLYPDAQRWNLSKREPLIAATVALLPYLRIKKRIAERFLEALEIFPKSRKAHLNGQRSWTPEMVAKVASIALSLNPYHKSLKQPAWVHLASAAIDDET